MTLEEQLQHDLKQAMKTRDQQRADVIRTLRAALQRAQSDAEKARYDAARQEIEAQGLSNREEDANEAGLTPLARALETIEIARGPLSEDEQQAVIAREVKRRREAAAMYQQAGKTAQYEQEESEAQILETYLPQQLSEDELRPQVAAIIAELGVSGPAAMGKVMPVLMERFKGRADGKLLSQLAREQLLQT